MERNRPSPATKESCVSADQTVTRYVGAAIEDAVALWIRNTLFPQTPYGDAA